MNYNEIIFLTESLTTTALLNVINFDKSSELDIPLFVYDFLCI